MQGNLCILHDLDRLARRYPRPLCLDRVVVLAHRDPVAHVYGHRLRRVDPEPALRGKADLERRVLAAWNVVVSKTRGSSEPAP